MNDHIKPELLARLGLDGFKTGPKTALQIPSSGIAHGYAGSQTLQSLTASDFMSLDWHPLTHPDASEIDAEISVLTNAPHFLHLNFASPVKLYTENAPVNAAVLSDGYSVLVSKRELDQPIAIVDEFARGLLLSIENAELFISQLSASTDNLPEIPRLSSDIKLWTNKLADAWLVDEINKHLETDNAWHHATAIGMLIRLRDPSSAEREDLLERLRTGTFQSDDAPAQDWIRALTEPEYTYLEQATLVRIEDTLFDIEEILTAREQSVPKWYQGALPILQHRDDIESVINLLGFAGRHTRLRNAVAYLDERGQELADCLDPLLVDADDVYEDEQLHRASMINPTDWWTQPGREI